MSKFLAGVAIVLFCTAIFAGVAWAADGASGGGDSAVGYLGGTAGVGGLGIVGYLLIRYLPKRDEDLMTTLKTKDATVIALIEKKDEQVMAALEKKDEMWSTLLEQNDKTWQANYDAMRDDLQALKATNDKLRQAVLHLAGKPGMTGLGVPQMQD
jgi:hypothetical protein